MERQGQAVQVLQAHRRRPAAGRALRCVADRLADGLCRAHGLAGYPDEPALGAAAESVDVTSQQASPTAGLSSHQERHRQQARIQGPKQLGELEIGEEAREAGGEGIAHPARRERLRGPRREGIADPPPQALGGGREDQDLGRQGVKEPRHLALVFWPGKQDPAGVGNPSRVAVGELQLRLQVPLHAEEHDARRSGRFEGAVRGLPQQRVAASGREAGKRPPDPLIAMDDPERRHGSRLSRVGSQPAGPIRPSSHPPAVHQAQSLCQVRYSSKRQAASLRSYPPTKG